MKIYLAGPINGCTDAECKDWRQWFRGNIGIAGVEWLDPMRRDYRGTENMRYREIVILDKRDIASCNFLVVMYSKPSVGTSMEILFAWERDIPILLINASRQGELSPWLKYHATAIVDSMEAAAKKLEEWCQ